MELKPWPTDRVQIVCEVPERFKPEGCRGKPLDSTCADCSCDIRVDEYSVQFAEDKYPMFAHAPKLICVGCFETYDRGMVTEFHDLRK